MNHEEATRYFDDLGERVPDRRPPMSVLVAAGVEAKRRKSLQTLALVAASIALILGGGAVARQLVGGSDGSPNREISAKLPGAPAGMRFVGMSGVVVAVPETWVVAGNGCARETGVVWRYPDDVGTGSASVDCPIPPATGHAASLGVGDLNSVEGRHLTPNMTTDGNPVQGAAVREGSGNNDTLVPEYCVPLPDSAAESCSMIFAVPSRGVFFKLSLSEEDARSQLDVIRNSLQLLPEGVTTVPFVQPRTPRSEAERVIEAAGLAAATDALSVEARVVDGTEPSSGSVVRVGETVKLLTDTGARSCPPMAPSKPPEPSDVPAPVTAVGLVVNESGTVAAWFEPRTATAPLPFLVVYDLVAGRELAREDLGVDDDRRAASLRVSKNALYYQSAADSQVWLQYRWGVDDFPTVYTTC